MRRRPGRQAASATSLLAATSGESVDSIGHSRLGSCWGISPLDPFRTLCPLTTHSCLQPVFKRSEQYSVFAAADQKVKEELFRLVYHYRCAGLTGSIILSSLLNRICSQIGRDMFGSPNDESKGETLPVGKMTK